MKNEEAIKLVKEVTGMSLPWGDAHYEALQMAIKALEQSTIKPDWILCSDRLPEIDSDGYSDKVLVCYQNFTGVEICEYRVIDGMGKWYIGDMDDSPEDLGIVVLAWMPLPEPYKEESEEE